MTEEKKEEPISTNGKEEVKPEVKQEEVKDFKVCEIWIRSGQVFLDATPNFWADRCRALGLLEFCKDIVKSAKSSEPPKPKIIPATNQMMNFARNLFKHRRN